MKKIENLRQEIDIIDQQIVDLFAQRFKKVQKIGTIKKENNLLIKDNKRWNQVLDNVMQLANINKIKPDFIKEIYELIHQYALEIEKNI